MSYWVIVVNRGNGRATSEFWVDRNAAWQRSLDLTSPDVYTTVVTATNPEGGQQ